MVTRKIQESGISLERFKARVESKVGKTMQDDKQINCLILDIQEIKQIKPFHHQAIVEVKEL